MKLSNFLSKASLTALGVIGNRVVGRTKSSITDSYEHAADSVGETLASSIKQCFFVLCAVGAICAGFVLVPASIAVCIFSLSYPNVEQGLFVSALFLAAIGCFFVLGPFIVVMLFATTERMKGIVRGVMKVDKLKRWLK